MWPPAKNFFSGCVPRRGAARLWRDGAQGRNRAPPRSVGRDKFGGWTGGKSGLARGGRGRGNRGGQTATVRGWPPWQRVASRSWARVGLLLRGCYIIGVGVTGWIINRALLRRTKITLPGISVRSSLPKEKYLEYLNVEMGGSTVIPAMRVPTGPPGAGPEAPA